MEKLLCGIDIGGTKSFAVLFDKKGYIKAKRISKGGTPVDYSYEEIASVYRDSIDGIFKLAGNNDIESVYISVATYEQYTELMNDAFGKAIADACKKKGQIEIPKLKIEDDGLCLISAAFGHNDGGGMICGTGSSLFVRHGEESYRVGGWGQYFGSVGSGFHLARLSIKAAFKAHDGIIGPTLLTDLLSEKAGCPIWDHYAELYKGGRSYVASFADCLFKAAELGDKAALDIFHSCAAELAELPTAARKREGRPMKIVLNGGIFANHPEYAAEVIRLSPADSEFSIGDMPPVYGCAVEAMHQLGLDELDEEFKQNFKLSL